MPHSVGEQVSTHVVFDVPALQRCTLRLEEGFNMSALAHFAAYNGGRGGEDGVRNQAKVSALLVGPVAAVEVAP
jgi:hypothetical protein